MIEHRKEKKISSRFQNFLGPLVPLLVKSPLGFKKLLASSPAYDIFLRFTSDVTPAYLLAVSIPAKTFYSPALHLRIQYNIVSFVFVEKCLLGMSDNYRPGNTFTTEDGCHDCVADSNCKLSCTITDKCFDKKSNSTKYSYLKN